MGANVKRGGVKSCFSIVCRYALLRVASYLFFFFSVDHKPFNVSKCSRLEHRAMKVQSASVNGFR